MGCIPSSQSKNKVAPFVREASNSSRAEESLRDGNKPGTDALEVPISKEKLSSQALEELRLKLGESERLRLLAESQLEGKLVIDLSAQQDEVIPVLEAELARLQPYGKRKSVGGRDDLDDGFSGTIKAQEQAISNLKLELKAANEKCDELKTKYDKQKRRSRISSAKAKAESQVRTLEIQEQFDKEKSEHAKCRDEIHRLKAQLVSSQNDAGASQDSQASVKPSGDDSDEDEGSSHMGLIVSLSSQIATLDEELRLAKEEINRLNANVPNSQ